MIIHSRNYNIVFVTMLHDSNISDYLSVYPVEWVPDMPDGVPPEEICVPTEHVLYRLIERENITESDLMTPYENDSNKDWGDHLAEAYALSMFDDLNKTNKLIKMPSLRQKKGVSRIVLNPADGVVKQTFSRKYHYSWWRTSCFNISKAETVMTL